MSEIQSLARGLKIMDMLANANRSMSITELAEALDIDKSSASRMVKTLVTYDYVQPEQGTRRFVLGRRFNQISWQLMNRLPVREKAKPYLYRLVDETGECSHTAIYSDGLALVIDDVEAESSSLRVVGGIGRRIPLHCTAVGKGLIASGDYPLPDTLTQRTPHTITDRDALCDHLKVIRSQGYALDDEENDIGVRCIAAPVYDYMGTVIATIGISGPTVRIPDERIAPLAAQVIRAARELSEELRG